MRLKVGEEEDTISRRFTALLKTQSFGIRQLAKQPRLYPAEEKLRRVFFTPHRQEHRGVGGLFFDDLNHEDFERTFDIVKKIGSLSGPRLWQIFQRNPLEFRNQTKSSNYTDEENTEV